MTDFFRPPTTPTARREHRCVAVGEKYSRQTGVYDGAWFVNKMHLQCFETLATSGEFTPGELEPPVLG